MGSSGSLVGGSPDSSKRTEMDAHLVVEEVTRLVWAAEPKARATLRMFAPPLGQSLLAATPTEVVSTPSNNSCGSSG